MARKTVISHYKVFNSINVAFNATSDITDVENLDQALVLIEWQTSGINAEIIVEARVQDKQKSEQSPWVTVDFGSPILINVDNSNHQLLFTSMPGNQIRFRFVSSAGTGSLTARLTAKTIGA